MFRTALRNVLAHKARLLMTVLAVMLGVAFVSGTLIFTDTYQNASDSQTAKSYAHVDVQVDENTEYSGESPGISRKTLDAVARLDSVADAVGRVDGSAYVADRDGGLIANGLFNSAANFAPGKDGKDPLYVFTDGSGPTRPGRIALDKDTADKGGYHVGDTVPVALTGPAKTYRLSGIFTTENEEVAAGGSLVLFDTPSAQRLFLQPGFFEKVTVTAAPGISNTELAAAISKVLPHSAKAKTGRQLAAEEAQLVAGDAMTLNGILFPFAGVALFVSVFLIGNTFTMLAAQRTRELALLRAVGASRRQVTRSVLIEAMMVGTVGAAAGLGLGAALAAVASATVEFDGGTPDGPLIVTSTTVLVAAVVGVLVTMVAAWLPARRAAKIPPVAAIGSAHLPATTKSLVLRNVLGGILTLLGAAVVVAGAGAGSSRGGGIVGFGAFLAVTGLLVLIPLLSRPVIAVVQPLLRRGFGVSGTLAGRNAVRSPRRTGATASALAIGLTLVSALTVLGVTLGQSMDKMTTDIVKADYMVTAGGARLDASAVAALRKVPGVRAVSQEQLGWMQLDGSQQDITAVIPADFDKALHLPVVSGSQDSLAKGQVAVDEKLARSHGWKVGDSLPAVYGDSGKGRRLTVGAVFKYNEVVMPVVVSADVIEANGTATSLSKIYVTTDGSTNEKALADALPGRPGIKIDDRQDIRTELGGAFNTVLNVLYALLAISLVIAILGVVNTLAMSVFERQREVGMLRAVGLDRPGVTRMIQLEAVVISLFGAVIGVGLGSFLGWAICEITKADIPGYALVLPWGRFALFLLLAALVGLLAALWPARSAARLNPLTAIKTE
ncbi:FtsX-like permease family protein [Streptomyces caniscabiei]|uniref:FtsX-like permease family protein n=1 Tax=Streptomyces caniscabiei TaxID=2746961 RepID=A0A927LBV9_9ACTN|nr:FtsX-like permease family protein [Streptomyces caniscabiei]MBD9729487.1 FtsX-like permease family protein [Streptomyces caniscabiei]MDX3515237.1 FtsX-like permease family protein [Streptomyces caniscabiei]MDX3724432.1 FtsX-like permease family protein [Streptomyces caniscabiei]MDX3732655.1 FtsX-like permease family protein [Streptomyces caniscabiei]WEO28925.1 FtsX-like permease family protein [Streptomyces caniscabiei]